MGMVCEVVRVGRLGMIVLNTGVTKYTHIMCTKCSVTLQQILHCVTV